MFGSNAEALYVGLEANSISTLPTGIFEDMSIVNGIWINMRDNNVTSFSSGTFDVDDVGYDFLQVQIDLAHNEITEWPQYCLAGFHGYAM